MGESGHARHHRSHLLNARLVSGRGLYQLRVLEGKQLQSGGFPPCERAPDGETTGLRLQLKELVVDQFRPARREPNSHIRDYRRGFEEKGGQSQLQKLWHFNEKCSSYPTRNFVIRKDRPSDDDLCSQCLRASYG